MPEMTEENYLAHYGILRKSGRYPWGSGNNPKQRSRTFLDILEEHRKAGLSEAQIAKLYDDKENGFPFTTTDLRGIKSRSVHIQKQDQIRTAQRLKDKGMGYSEIGRKMGGINESTVRSLLAPGRQEKLDILQQTANMLKKEVETKPYLDVGAHVQRDLPIDGVPGMRISKDKFDTALSMLKEEGYQVHQVKIPQVGTGEMTTFRVLTKSGVTQKEVFLNRDKIQTIAQKTENGGRSWEKNGLKPPLNVDPKRVDIRYKEDGGADADGVIYVRPGVTDVSLGKANYAQVRIAVGGSHYLKGMAIYKDDLPKGIDLQFNTNKSDTGDKFDAMKPMKKDKNGNIDPKNPFGASIKPNGQIKDDKDRVISSMNLINEEGDWNTWSRNLSRQVLSKQSPSLAKSQLDLTYQRRLQEFEEIKSLTNPLIKKKLMESFAEDTDSSAVHLKAANLPRQATKVLLPVNSVKPNEIFAPTFENGERVSLVRFPHAGTFEIPELTVNNRNKEASALFRLGRGGNAPDAVGIHPKVAQHLSGADFDGDSVVVIPNNRGLISNTRPLEGLKNFDPQIYKVPKGPPTKEYPEGKPIIKDGGKQVEMGKVTNLIADMTLKGATADDLAAAVRHSMVVIDSEKHNLDYKASERDNKILALKKKYQGRVDDKGQLRTGAATLITRATSRYDVVKRKARLVPEGGPIDPVTGEKRYTPTGERNQRGELKTFRSKRLAEVTDAHTLVSEGKGTEIEKVYADHSNKLKDLANKARLETLKIKTEKASPSAKAVYATEVAQLDAKLNIALKNAPLERQAQVLANTIVHQKKQDNPDMERSEVKKIRGQALEEARLRTGAGKTRIDITPREWDAIQSRAISNNKLEQILSNTDVDKIRKLATPREKPVMTDYMTSRAQAMLSKGATYAEVSEALGIPMSTLQSGIGGEGG